MAMARYCTSLLPHGCASWAACGPELQLPAWVRALLLCCAIGCNMTPGIRRIGCRT